MRIGIDCRSLQEKQPSGVSCYTRELLRAMLALPAARSQQFVFFVNGVYLRQNSTALREIQKNLGAANVTWRVRNLPNKLLTSSEIIWQQPSVRWLFGQVDAVFLPNMQFFPWRDTGQMPFVLTVHDLSFERYVDCFSWKGRLWHKFIQLPALARAARQCIAVSPHTKSDLEQLYKIPSEKITVVSPGVGDLEQEWPQNSANNSAGIFQKIPENIYLFCQQKFICALSTVEPRKNITTLIAAFELLQPDFPELKLVIAGKKGWQSDRCFTHIGKNKNILYVGYVDRATKIFLLSNAQIFVYPALYEGFGFPPLEAQKLGTPVIAGGHSSLGEVLEGSAMLVNVHDVQSVATGLHHLLVEPELREYFRQKGLANVRRFNWPRAAQQTLDILLNCRS